MNNIVIETMMGQNRIAVTRQGSLEHFFTDRESDWSTYGNIYIGRVEQIKPGMQVAFVNIGGEKNGLLHLSDIYPNPDKLPIDKVIKKGQDIIVQVKKEAVGTKGARLTTKYWISGHYLVLLPTEEKIYMSKKIKNKEEIKRLKGYLDGIKPVDVGVILRTEAEGASLDLIEKELDYLMGKWRLLNSRIHIAPKLLFKDKGPVIKVIRDYYTTKTDQVVLNSDAYIEEVKDYFSNYFPDDMHKIKLVQKLNIFDDYDLEPQIKELYARKLWLKSGGYIIIDNTEAFTVIDVNSGKFTGHKDPEETIARINLEATEVIAHQMRLRNLSGIILIDYINITKEKQKEKIIKKWREMSARDKVRFKLVGFTELSILQITRKQEGKSIVNINRQTCPLCDGTGDVYNQEALFYKCLAKIENDMYLLNHNRFKIIISPYLKNVIDEHKHFGHGFSFDQMLEDFYKVKVEIEVNINNEFDQVAIIPSN